jgi:hypothetical protein
LLDRDPRVGFEAAADDVQILLPRLGAEHVAPPVQEERRVIADPGTDLQHALIAEVEPERGQVFLTAGIVATVELGVKMLFGSSAIFTEEWHRAMISHLDATKWYAMVIELLNVCGKTLSSCLHIELGQACQRRADQSAPEDDLGAP